MFGPFNSTVLSMHQSFYGPYMMKVVVVNLFEAMEEKSVDHAIWENHLRPSIEVND